MSYVAHNNVHMKLTLENQPVKTNTNFEMSLFFLDIPNSFFLFS